MPADADAGVRRRVRDRPAADRDAPSAPVQTLSVAWLLPTTAVQPTCRCGRRCGWVRGHAPSRTGWVCVRAADEDAERCDHDDTTRHDAQTAQPLSGAPSVRPIVLHKVLPCVQGTLEPQECKGAAPRPLRIAPRPLHAGAQRSRRSSAKGWSVSSGFWVRSKSRSMGVTSNTARSERLATTGRCRVPTETHLGSRAPRSQRPCRTTLDAAPGSTPEEAARAGPRRTTESMLVLHSEIGVGRATLPEEIAKASRGLGMAVMATGRASRVEIPFAAPSPLMIRRFGRIWVFLPSSRPHLGWASGSTRRDAVATVACT